MTSITNIMNNYYASVVLASLTTVATFTGDAAESVNITTNSSPALTSASDPLLYQPNWAASNAVMQHWVGTNGGSYPIAPQIRSHRLSTNRPMLSNMNGVTLGTNHIQALGQSGGRVFSASHSALKAQMETARERMISEQLIARGIANQAVLAAIRKVPRLLPYEVATNAYEDMPVNIRYGRTVESPFVVASVAEQFNPYPKSTDKVLELIGNCFSCALIYLTLRG